MCDILSVGRRKRAVAQVRLKQGSGKLLVNEKGLEEYMAGSSFAIKAIMAPLEISLLGGSCDISVKVSGGGVAGQAKAIQLGIARALCALKASHRSPLKEKGFLSRDSRRKERKKYGLKKARKAPQYSKR